MAQYATNTTSIAASQAPRLFAERTLSYFFPIHYQFGMAMEQAMGQGRLGRKHAALLWLIHSEHDQSGWVPRKVVEACLSNWFEMSNPNITKVIKDISLGGDPLVKISTSPGSRREKVLGLTEAGRAFIDGMVDAAQQLLMQWVGHMPPKELEDGLRFMRKAFGYAPTTEK
jgi:DNA-binding MarR family transcriptional regulator